MGNHGIHAHQLIKGLQILGPPHPPHLSHCSLQMPQEEQLQLSAQMCFPTNQMASTAGLLLPQFLHVQNSLQSPSKDAREAQGREMGMGINAGL